MERIQKQIEGKLTEDHIPFRRVYGRMKHPYSIYRKMYAQSKTMDEVFDLFAFRVIVDTVADCYNVLGVIHDLYQPRARPLQGLYRHAQAQRATSRSTPRSSARTASRSRCRSARGRCTDIAEYGIAAHWKYKQGIYRQRPTSRTTNGSAVSSRTRRIRTPRNLSTPSRSICSPTRCSSSPRGAT